MTRSYRAINAEFNALYNGNIALEQGKRNLTQNIREDYFEILPIELIKLEDDIQLPGESRNTDFKRAEDKAVIAIQRHSIYFDGKEHNPQIDEAYMLLGKARYYDSRFIPAIEAFNFILHRYPTSNSINTAKIWREKTNIRLQNEEVALRNLKTLFKQAKLSNDDFADASAMMAQAYINLDSLDNAIVHIKDAAEFTRDNEKKGRLLFIKGQIYNRLGQKDSANLAFDEVIDLNRRSPRIYMIHAKMGKIKNFDYASGDIEEIKEKFEKLTNDRENRPYLDVIYHNKGSFYAEIGEIDEAVVAYNKAIKEFKQNQRLQALNYSSLGDIYFDKAEYRTAGSYYDSTLQRLVENTRDHRQIKRKRDNLEDVIKYEDLAVRNDSILSLVAMNEGERLAYFTDYTSKLRQRVVEDSLSRLKQEQGFKSDEFFTGRRGSERATDGKFYFYNTTAVAFGKQEFRRQWGDRRLEDDWRRSNKNVVLDTGETASRTDEQTKSDVLSDRFKPETYIALIPSEKKVIDSISRERDMAYYQLGLIYKEKFRVYDLAIERLEKLLTFKPEERLEIPAKYHLYKTFELLDNASKMQQYRNDIVTNHPDSRYAEIILNPNVILAADESTPEFRYVELYRLFEKEQYAEVIEKSDRYINQFFGDEMVPKFEMLKATAIGRQDGFEAYKKAINFVSLNYTNTPEGRKANTIYNTQLPKLERFDFEANNDTDRWKLLYEFNVSSRQEAEAFKKKLDEAVVELGFGYLDTSIDYYTPNKILVVVHGLLSRDGAKGFAERLKENRKYRVTHPYVEISSPNYAVIQVHKNLDLYNAKIK
jgi:tetratricopeptide (TPR) repeat protein